MDIDTTNYKNLYDEYFSKIQSASECAENNPCSKLIADLESVEKFIQNQLNNLSDWQDSAKESLSSNLQTCLDNLESIKTNISTNWAKSEKLYKTTKNWLISLKGWYDVLDSELSSEPRKISYKDVSNDGIISYPGYSQAHSEWESKCIKFDNNCKGLVENITKNLNDLAIINANIENYEEVSVSFLNPAGIDLSIYATDPFKGFSDRGISFGLSTGNQTYDLPDDELNLLYAIVASEAAHNPDDALGVTSVILNRAESGLNFLGGPNPTPISIATANGQFEGYFKGNYRAFLNANGEYKGDSVISQAVDDALNGVRNTNALYFLANSCTYYSDNLITPDGNRYKMTW